MCRLFFGTLCKIFKQTRCVLESEGTSSERALLTRISQPWRSPASQPPSPQTAVPTVIP